MKMTSFWMRSCHVATFSIPCKAQSSTFKKAAAFQLSKIDERSVEFFALLEFPLCGQRQSRICDPKGEKRKNYKRSAFTYCRMNLLSSKIQVNSAADSILTFQPWMSVTWKFSHFLLLRHNTNVWILHSTFPGFLSADQESFIVLVSK